VLRTNGACPLFSAFAFTLIELLVVITIMHFGGL